MSADDVTRARAPRPSRTVGLNDDPFTEDARAEPHAKASWARARPIPKSPDEPRTTKAWGRLKVRLGLTLAIEAILLEHPTVAELAVGDDQSTSYGRG